MNSNPPTLPEYLRDEVLKFGQIVDEQVRLLRTLGVARASLRGERGLATGAGDSHAASVYAQLISNHEFMAADPYELRSAPPSERDYLIAVSVKGRTREVIECVRHLKTAGWRALAVTADPKSELADIADATLQVSYGGGALPVGVGNFASVITALTWVLTDEDVSPPKELHEPKVELARYLSGDGVNEVVAVGEGVGAVSAYFTCLKLYETLCMPCRSYSIEQFLHAPIYSLTKDSLTLIFTGRYGVKSRVLQSILEDAGLRHEVISASEGGALATVLDEVGQVILAIADTALMKGVLEPCFESRLNLLKASTPVIYTPIK